MTWVRIDDEFYDHPKFLDLDFEAVGLWAVGLAYCNRYGTDGHIPTGALPRIAPHHDNRLQIAVKLVDRGLWEPVSGGWQMHNYLDFQPSAEQVQAKKKARQEAGRRGGLARAQANARANAQAIGQARGLNPDPTRPDPYIDTPTTALEGDPQPVDMSWWGEVWTHYADRAALAERGVKNPVAWKAAVAKKARVEQRERAEQLAATYDLTPYQLACVLAGETSILTTATRRAS